MSRIVDRDNGWKALTKRVKDLEKRGAKVTVGVHSAEGVFQYKEDAADPVIKIAALQEFRDVPGGWLRATVDSSEGLISRLLVTAAALVVTGKATVSQAFSTAGEILEPVFRSRMGKDTGLLRASVRTKVRGNYVT